MFFISYSYYVFVTFKNLIQIKQIKILSLYNFFHVLESSLYRISLLHKLRNKYYNVHFELFYIYNLLDSLSFRYYHI